MLHRLARLPTNLFHVVDTQLTLSAADWANELHPFPAGFAKIAQLFSDALSQHVRPADMGAARAASAEALSPTPPGRTATVKSSAKKPAGSRSKVAATKGSTSQTGRSRKVQRTRRA